MADALIIETKNIWITPRKSFQVEIIESNSVNVIQVWWLIPELTPEEKLKFTTVKRNPPFEDIFRLHRNNRNSLLVVYCVIFFFLKFLRKHFAYKKCVRNQMDFFSLILVSFWSKFDRKIATKFLEYNKFEDYNLVFSHLEFLSSS